MLERIVRWLLPGTVTRLEGAAREAGYAAGRQQGSEDSRLEAHADAMRDLAGHVKRLLDSGHVCFLPYRHGADAPVAFTRPREPFHLLAAEVQMSEQPKLDPTANVQLLRGEPDWCERIGADPEMIQAAMQPEAWARARAIDQILPKLVRLIDAKVTDREAVPGMPGRRRYTVAVSVQRAEEL